MKEGKEVSPAEPTARPTNPSLVRKGYQEFRARFPEIGFWIGVFAAVYFWVAVAYDGHLNASWWNFYGHSFSALGDPGPNSTGAAAGLSWVYNEVVLFPTAIMIMAFGAALTMGARNRIQSTGSSFFIVAGMFLFLVGIYHGETVNAAGLYCSPVCAGIPPYPPAYHDFVSDWFFIQAAISIVIWGFGLLWERRVILGGSMLAMVIFGLVFAAYAVHAYSWSVAQTEAYGILIIDTWLALMYFGRNPRSLL